MDSIKNMVRRLRDFDKRSEEIVIQVSKQFEAEILDMNTQEQLFNKGIDADGDSLGKYATLTKQIKAGLGQPTNRVTLKDTGDFHDSFFARFVGKNIAIGATDEKAEKLEDRYGKAIYGLTDDNLQEVIDMVRPEMINEFRKRILK
jgi:hypothetical protein